MADSESGGDAPPTEHCVHGEIAPVESELLTSVSDCSVLNDTEVDVGLNTPGKRKREEDFSSTSGSEAEDEEDDDEYGTPQVPLEEKKRKLSERAKDALKGIFRLSPEEIQAGHQQKNPKKGKKDKKKRREDKAEINRERNAKDREESCGFVRPWENGAVEGEEANEAMSEGEGGGAALADGASGEGAVDSGQASGEEQATARARVSTESEAGLGGSAGTAVSTDRAAVGSVETEAGVNEGGNGGPGNEEGEGGGGTDSVENEPFQPATEHRGKDRKRQRRNSKREQEKERTQAYPGRQSNVNSKPVFFAFPVIVEEAKNNDQIRKLGPYGIQKYVQQATGRAIGKFKQLPSGKWVFGCDDKAQQTKFSQQTKLANIEIKCTIPVPNVEGVIKGIPLSDEAWTAFLKEANSREDISRVMRLNDRRGQKTTAVKITFRLPKLPDTVCISGQLMDVFPFRAQVRRCTRCQKLGHVTSKCRQKHNICGQCGRPNHHMKECKSEPRCVNCHGTHRSGDPMCPEKLIWQRATEERAQTFMPFSSALTIARNQSPKQNDQIAEQECRKATEGVSREHWDLGFPSLPTVAQVGRPASLAPHSNGSKNRIKDNKSDRIDINRQRETSTKLGAQSESLPKQRMNEDNMTTQSDSREKNVWKDNYPPAYFTSNPLSVMDTNDRATSMNVQVQSETVTSKEPVGPAKNGWGGARPKDKDVNKAKGLVAAGGRAEPMKENVIDKESLENITRAQEVAISAGEGACFQERGNRILMSLAKFRNDQNVQGLLTALYYPSPPPKMSQLLVLTLLAAGILDKKPENFINLDSF